MLRFLAPTTRLLDQSPRALRETRCAAAKQYEQPEPITEPGTFPKYVGPQLTPLLPAWTWKALLGLLVASAVSYELQTSALQSRLLPQYAAKLTYAIEPGSSSPVVYPRDAPYDRRLGYSLLPEFTRRLESRGYSIVEQAWMSERMSRLAQLGISPPYPEPPSAGLVIRAAHGDVMFDGRLEQRLFDRFEDVPPLVVTSLLYIENRELLAVTDPRQNLAVDWDRLAKAGLLHAGRQLGLDFEREGGSTLATQIEKFRHSPGGRTGSVGDKLRQMAAAMLKVYRMGANAHAERRRIVVDYLSSMPLAAAPGYGEVHGLGEGLHAWFGLDLEDVFAALESTDEGRRAHAFKHVLALLCAVRAPTQLLLQDRSALVARMDSYTELLERDGFIAPAFARRVRETPLHFAEPPRVAAPVEGKAVAAMRTQLLGMLGVPGLYELDRLDLEAHSTIDVRLQRAADELLDRLADPSFLDAHQLREARLLSQGDPAAVAYTLLLYEATPNGNLLRVHADSLDRPFDLNTGMKMELGSTAKLRTVAHYLQLIADLYDDLRARPTSDSSALPRDPITQWAASTLAREPEIDLEAFLDAALERRYSASPAEAFFTGGGAHVFKNFDARDNAQWLTVRTALVRSTNLVFIRLMRDLARFHAERLPYDAEALLSDPRHPLRRPLLEEIADEEGTAVLREAYRRYADRPQSQVIRSLLRERVSPRRLAVLFYAWRDGGDAQTLERWLAEHAPEAARQSASSLARAYGNPDLTLADYGYLLGVHPLEIWAAGELLRTRTLSFADLDARAAEPKRISSAWLFRERNRKAQDLRLKIRVERDAFARMTPYWQRLGFPFERLVPSYATAIGSSSDRPTALAELMGIIVNDGWRRPTVSIERLRFAANTPYHTVFARNSAAELVMSPAVASALREVLAEVVAEGTGRRMKDAVRRADGMPIKIGGKTGSGDNRYETFTRGGQLKSSRAVNRTATFVFYIGDGYYGVVTASVDGALAERYRFTSSLPLAVLKLFATEIET